MKRLLLLFLVVFAANFASAQTDLFFSEYVEGSGNNKALEIYNPTNQTIDLSSYYVVRFSNGATTFTEGGATRLSGMLESFKTFVFVNGQITSTSSSPACSPVLQALADQLDGDYPAPTYMNGNDAMALIKTPNGEAPLADMSNVTPVDLFGEIGLGANISAETGWSYVQDTTVTYTANDVEVTGKVVNYIVKKYATNGSSFGPFWMSWTSGHSLIRKATVIEGVKTNPSPFNVSLEWYPLVALDSLGLEVYEDIWSNLGTHECVAASAGIGENDFGAKLDIYPNPVSSGRFLISSGIAVKEVEIYSVTGQTVYRQSYNKMSQQIEISDVDLQKGLYLVKVTSRNNTVAVKKVVVN
ncbi:MAG: lamin tail domain-containing protein [Lentimicrobium sp.]|jgi:hypothetical protein|nr:lamin tail domain-containing protein [Lentimicrobium sp.]